MPAGINFISIKTPLGGFALASGDKGLCSVIYCENMDHRRAGYRIAAGLAGRFGRVEPVADGTGLDTAAAWLRAFIADPRAAGIYPGPVDPGGTAFQRKVWDQLSAIPAGRTRAYGEIARAVGSPGAARAVGEACGANPLLIFIPCHRVVGADRSLTGFGAGLDLKRRLLSAEGFFDSIPDLSG